MKQRSSIILFLTLLILSLQSISLSAQADSVIVVTEPVMEENRDSTSTLVKEHSPRKASILSAVLPGAGQAYNKKYWKIPIVYAGLGVSVYFLDRNVKQINFYRKNLTAEIDNDPNTLNLTGLSSESLNKNLNAYKRLRDISYIYIAGFYLLQIVDAQVDAYLWRFDVSDDLSVIAQPKLLITDLQPMRAGFSLTLNF